MADASLDMQAVCADRVGVIFGTAAGGVERVLTQQQILLERGPDRVSPMFLPHFLPDSASGLVAIALGAEGPNMAVASACATGSHAVGEGFKTVQRDDADVVVAGGTEASILPVIYAGFINMKALSSRNDSPRRASRPFDVRPGTRMAAIQKQRPRPDVDRLFVLAGEIMVETPEEELFDLRIAIGIRRAFERAGTVGTKRVGHRWRRDARIITLMIED